MTEVCGSFVGETQDRTYAPGNNRNDPGDNQSGNRPGAAQPWPPTRTFCCTAANWAKPIFHLGKCFNDC